MTGVSVAEFLLIVSTVGGAVAWLLKFHSDRNKENRELGKIDIEAWGLLRGQVTEMEKRIAELRDRVDTLEEQVDVKDATIRKLDARLSKILIYLSGLLKELDSKGVQYTKPEPGLLETDPNIKAIKKPAP